MAARRTAGEIRGVQVQLKVVSNERIGELSGAGVFDGAFSNFSGLNCVADLSAVALQLASLIKPCGRILLCFSAVFVCGRYCVPSTMEKCRGQCGAGREVPQQPLVIVALRVRYPTMTDIRKQFRPFFRLRGCKGIGVAVPRHMWNKWLANIHTR